VDVTSTSNVVIVLPGCAACCHQTYSGTDLRIFIGRRGGHSDSGWLPAKLVGPGGMHPA